MFAPIVPVLLSWRDRIVKWWKTYFSTTDLDECSIGHHDCHRYIVCHNVIGSYTCYCSCFKKQKRQFPPSKRDVYQCGHIRRPSLFLILSIYTCKSTDANDFDLNWEVMLFFRARNQKVLYQVPSNAFRYLIFPPLFCQKMENTIFCDCFVFLVCLQYTPSIWNLENLIKLLKPLASRIFCVSLK